MVSAIACLIFFLMSTACQYQFATLKSVKITTVNITYVIENIASENCSENGKESDHHIALCRNIDFFSGGVGRVCLFAYSFWTFENESVT